MSSYENKTGLPWLSFFPRPKPKYNIHPLTPPGGVITVNTTSGKVLVLNNLYLLYRTAHDCICHHNASLCTVLCIALFASLYLIHTHIRFPSLSLFSLHALAHSTYLPSTTVCTRNAKHYLRSPYILYHFQRNLVLS